MLMILLHIFSKAFLEVTDDEPSATMYSHATAATKAVASQKNMHLLCVNSRGDLRVWDLRLRSLKCSCSVVPLLTSQVHMSPSDGSSEIDCAHLERVSIDILGNVLAHVASANHHDPRIRKQSETASNVSDNNKSKLMKPRVIRSYVWDVGMGSWLRTSSEDFVQSTYYSTLASSNESVVQGSNIMEHAMQKLQQTTARLQVQEEQRTRHQRHTPLFSLNALVNEAPEWAMLDTIAHLQHQLTVAVSLRDAVSFKAWLGTYVSLPMSFIHVSVHNFFLK